MDSTLGNNSYIADITHRLVKFKKHEDNLIAANRIHEEGITIIVSYNEDGEDVYYVVTCDGRTPFNDLPKESGGGGGEGTVKDINGIAPDASGTVQLEPSDIGAATETDLQTVENTANGKVAKAGDTMTGPLVFSDPNNRSKAILTKYPSGSGHNNAPTAFDKTSVYLHLGGTEYNTNSYRLIGFGYRRNEDQSHAAAVIGYQETNSGSDDYGKLLFATRNVNSDTAPTVRLTIEPNGDIQAQTGAKFVGDGSGLTNLPATPVTSASITDATTVGKEVLTSTDADAARSAIGAVSQDDLANLSVAVTNLERSTGVEIITQMSDFLASGDITEIRSALAAAVLLSGDNTVLRGDGLFGQVTSNFIGTGAVNNAHINNLAGISLSKLGNLTTPAPVNTALTSGISLMTALNRLQGQINAFGALSITPTAITDSNIDGTISANRYIDSTTAVTLTQSNLIDGQTYDILVRNTGATTINVTITGVAFKGTNVNNTIPASGNAIISMKSINGTIVATIAV